MRPREMCFSTEVKKEAKERSGYKCEVCGKKLNDRELQIDHLIPIWFAQQYPLFAPAVISSIANSRAICDTCHKNRDHEDKDEITKLAAKVARAFLEESLHPREKTWRDEVKQYEQREPQHNLDQRNNQKIRKNRRRKRK